MEMLYFGANLNENIDAACFFQPWQGNVYQFSLRAW